MNSNIIVDIRNISKKYKTYESAKYQLIEVFHPRRKKFYKEFWALRNINFSIKKGLTIGILGVNGSGKSTLLQLICSVLSPTYGEIKVNGKIAALLELGAGFNPELTGYQNVLLNLAIQGLSKDATEIKLPEIQKFADIGDFFYKPVKTYSSGMFMRLAFATAISVDPDILIIDEALAVGDARFQQKCYAKFKEFQEGGKTIILVTHDRFTVGKLCDEAILLDKGQIIANGEVQYVMNCYEELLAKKDSELLEISEDNSGPAINLKNREKLSILNNKNSFFSKKIDKKSILKNPTYNKYERRFGNKAVEIIDYLMISNSLLNQSTIESGSEVELYLKVLHHKLIGNLNYGISIFTKEGILVHGINTYIKNINPSSLGENGLSIYKITMKLFLGPGDYFISPAIADGSEILCDVRQQAIHIRIFDKLAYTGILNMPSVFQTVEESFINEN